MLRRLASAVVFVYSCVATSAFALEKYPATVDPAVANTWTALQTFSAGLTVSGGQILVPNGTAAAPSFAFANTPGTGFYSAGTGSGAIRYSANSGGPDIQFSSVGINLSVNHIVGWSASNGANAADTILLRDAANTLALRNGTAAQALNLYKIFTDASNYERLKIWADATNNVFRLDSEAAGTGTVRNIAFMGGNVGIGIQPTFKLHVSGNFAMESGKATLSGATGIGTSPTSGRYLSVGSATYGVYIVGGSTAALAVASGNSGFGTDSPLTTAHVNGGLAVGVVSKTAAYTATGSDFVILANATAGAFTVTLPAATQKGQRIVVVKVDSSVNAVTVSRSGSDTIEGATTKSLASQYQKTEVIADGTATWYDLDTGLI